MKIDLINQTFGRLTVMRHMGSTVDGRRLWECACSCGGRALTTTNNLRSGNTASCGCSRKDNPPRRTHGLRKSMVYESWRGMLQRCGNPNKKSYANYGGRGIIVCERWMRFENFYADVGDPPSPKHSLDRYPDNDGNYEPGNCRWATRTEQNTNKRNNHWLNYLGERKTLVQWAKDLRIDRSVIQRRLKRGWPIEKAFKRIVEKAA